MNRNRATQGGFTLIEMSIALAISTMLIGTIFLVQKTATESFEGTLVEHEATRSMRVGLDEIKQELRSCLHSSVVSQPWSGDPLIPMLTFQQAVSFDSANGLTLWGGGDEVGGKVEYIGVNDEIVRVVRNASNDIVDERVLIDDIDLDPGAGNSPVQIQWDKNTSLIFIQVRRAIPMHDRIVRRKLETNIYVDPVLEF